MGWRRAAVALESPGPLQHWRAARGLPGQGRGCRGGVSPPWRLKPCWQRELCSKGHLPRGSPELFLSMERPPWLCRTSGVGAIEAEHMGGQRGRAGFFRARSGLLGISQGCPNKGPQAGGFKWRLILSLFLEFTNPLHSLQNL